MRFGKVSDGMANSVNPDQTERSVKEQSDLVYVSFVMFKGEYLGFHSVCTL